MPNKSQYRFGIELKDKEVNEMDTPSLETKYRCVVKCEGSTVKRSIGAPNETLYTLAVRPRPKTGYPTYTRRLDNEEKNTLCLTHGIPGNHRHYYPDSMGLIIHKEENYANK